MTTLSSLNRHACATLEDVGSPKVIAMQKFFKKVAPWAQYVLRTLKRLVRPWLIVRVEVKVGLYRKGQSESWLEGADWVVDAIDNIDTKVDLLTHCHQNGIKVFSSMGSGAKRDPTRVQIAYVTIQKSSLSRAY
jgi:tRNA A37 threonylcarbamoyladenosine dehydratase